MGAYVCMYLYSTSTYKLYVADHYSFIKFCLSPISPPKFSTPPWQCGKLNERFQDCGRTRDNNQLSLLSIIFRWWRRSSKSLFFFSLEIAPKNDAIEPSDSLCGYPLGHDQAVEVNEQRFKDLC